jgi:putative phosphoesterase
MKVGLLSDVHANRVALEAVLADMPPVDRIVNAGDVVGYNPWPRACVEAMWDPSAVDDSAPAGPVPTVMGNHDRATHTDTAFGFNGMAQAGVAHARERLDDEHLEWLGELPDEQTLFDGLVKVVHGHPEDPDRYTYPDMFGPELLGDEQVLVLGHTHVQAAERFDEGVVVNPGSVGQPRDRDPRAAYATLDLDAAEVELHRVEYDVGTVQAAVEDADLPEQIGGRLAKGR